MPGLSLKIRPLVAGGSLVLTVLLGLACFDHPALAAPLPQPGRSSGAAGETERSLRSEPAPANYSAATTGADLYNSIQAHLGSRAGAERNSMSASAARDKALTALEARAGGKQAVSVRFSQGNGTLTLISMQGAGIRPAPARGASRAALALSFVGEIRDLMQLNKPAEELQLVADETDKRGRAHLRFQQVSGGIPVFGQQLLVHMNRDTSIYLLNGRFQPSRAELVRKPAISAGSAVTIVSRDLQRSEPLVPDVAPELVYLATKNGAQTLSYRIQVTPSLAESWQYFIHAGSGQVLLRINNIHEGAAVGTGQDLTGATRSFNVWQHDSDGKYYLIDPTTPTPAHNPDPVADGAQALGDTWLLDFHSGVDLNLAGMVSSTDAGSWADATAVSAAWNIRLTYDYYRNTFGRHSIDGNDMNLVGYIHYDNGMDNAYWFGDAMVFGDGGGIFSSTAKCADLVAHEMTHGVIQFSANLVYVDQSGALNESFADVFGAMVDRDDWLMSDGCIAPSPGYLRNLAHPLQGLSAQPEHMRDYNQMPANVDSDGVHTNSGIPNRAAWLIAEGLSTEELGVSIGRDDTEQIYHLALTSYLTPTAQFIDARRALLQAAEDLFGTASVQVAAVAAAFDEVGVTEDGVIEDSGLGGTGGTAVNAAGGDDMMVYMAPVDGVYDTWPEPFSIWVQRYPTPFDSVPQDGRSGPYNDPADGVLEPLYTHPAVYVDGTGPHYFYLGTDNNIYLAVLHGPDLALTSRSDIYGFTISPDGKYVAYVSMWLYDTYIYILDMDTGAVTPHFIRDNRGVADVAYFYAADMSFDFSGRYIVFDFYTHLNTGDGFWSIAILDLEAQGFHFPFPAQNHAISRGYPRFAGNKDYQLVMNEVDYAAYNDSGEIISRTITYNTLTGVIGEVYRHSNDQAEHWSTPSFWGDDNYVSMMTPSLPGQAGWYSFLRREINEDGTGVGDVQPITPVSGFMPVMFRDGHREYTITSSADSLAFRVGPGAGSQTLPLPLSNTTDNPARILTISVNNPAFVSDGADALLPGGGSVTINVTYAGGGTSAGTLSVDFDGPHPSRQISLTATTTADTSAPVVHAPDDLVIFSNVNVGRDHPDIVAFLSAVNASDNVGVVGAALNDAPNVFVHGQAVTITFTAVDAAGNIGTATAKIRIKSVTDDGEAGLGAVGPGGGGVDGWSLGMLLLIWCGVRWHRACHYCHRTLSQSVRAGGHSVITGGVLNGIGTPAFQLMPKCAFSPVDARLISIALPIERTLSRCRCATTD